MSKLASSPAAGRDTDADAEDVDTDTDDAPAERAWLFCALGLVLVAVLYVQVLGGPFIWDDRPLILESEAIRRLDVVRFFSEPLWAGKELQSSAYFRSLVALSFALDYQLHGENSGGYHLTNLLLHLTTTALVFAHLRRRAVSVPLSFVLSTAWALLPRLTEGVAWISGRADVLAAAFVLAALWVYRPSANLSRLALASGLALLALFCKETGLAAFAGLALSLWLERKSPALARPGLRWLVLGLPLAGYFALRACAGALSLGETVPLSALVRAETALEALGRYAWMLLDFWHSSSYLGWLGKLDFRFVALGVVALGGLALLARRARQAAPATLVLAAVAAVPLLLVLHLLPLPVAVVASDRYLYLPTAALIIAAAPWLDGQVRRRRALILAPLALLVLASVKTYQRASDYTDEAQFWVEAVRHAPDQPLALAELGSVAYRAGCAPEALDIYLRAVGKSDGRSSIPLENAALLAAMNGDDELAAQLADQLLRAFPGRAELELRRATVALAALQFDLAERHAARAQQLAPGSEAPRGLVEVIRAARRDRHEELTQRGMVGPALALAIRTQRLAQVTALVRRMLERDLGDPAALVRGLQVLVARGDPHVAERFLQRYRELGDSRSATQLEAALAPRIAEATNVRGRLRELTESGVLPAKRH